MMVAAEHRTKTNGLDEAHGEMSECDMHMKK